VTPAQELAAAADKLDALASKATEGPWVANRADVYHPPLAPFPDDRTYVAKLTALTVPNATYIAAMNPLVGKALAVVLREASYTIDNNVNILVPRGLTAVPVSGGLLDLARLINGSAA
jgi:hypothetical protein